MNGLKQIPPFLIVIVIAALLMLALALATRLNQTIELPEANTPITKEQERMESETSDNEERRKIAQSDTTSIDQEIRKLPISNGELISFGSAYAPSFLVPVGWRYATHTLGLSVYPCAAGTCETDSIQLSWSAQTNPEKEVHRLYGYDPSCDQYSCEAAGDIGGRIRVRQWDGYLSVVFWYSTSVEPWLDQLESNYVSPLKKFDGPWECISPPVGAAIGSIDYPAFERYANLDRFLGGMFTEVDCAEQGFTQKTVTGIYDLGVDLGISENAPEMLHDILKEIGFMCADSSGRPCTHWRLTQPVPVEDLLKLRPFAPHLLGSDCINCG